MNDAVCCEYTVSLSRETEVKLPRWERYHLITTSEHISTAAWCILSYRPSVGWSGPYFDNVLIYVHAQERSQPEPDVKRLFHTVTTKTFLLKWQTPYR